MTAVFSSYDLKYLSFGALDKTFADTYSKITTTLFPPVEILEIWN